MSYDYKTERPKLFTEDGVRKLMVVKDKALSCIKVGGAVMLGNLIQTGDSWESMACFDYLVETGVLREVTDIRAAGQYRVFAAPFN